MKIEDINYILPTRQIAEKNFDKEKWIKENPIDYYKFIYVLFVSSDVAPHVDKNLVMAIKFSAIYEVTRLYIPDTLYKFFSLNEDDVLNEKKFETLRNKKIYMANAREFNDPFDGKAFFYDHKELSGIKQLKEHDGKLIDDFTSWHRETALTKNDTSSMPMWAHYANNHKGYCVAYDMNDATNIVLKGCTFPIQYTEERLDITTYIKNYAEKISAEVDRQIKLGVKEVLFDDFSLIFIEQYLSNIKHLSWQYENEFRCSIGEKDNQEPYINANPKAIYIGINCSNEHKTKLIEIANSLSIPIYEMRINNFSEKFSLEEHLVGETYD